MAAKTGSIVNGKIKPFVQLERDMTLDQRIEAHMDPALGSVVILGLYMHADNRYGLLNCPVADLVRRTQFNEDVIEDVLKTAEEEGLVWRDKNWFVLLNWREWMASSRNDNNGFSLITKGIAQDLIDCSKKIPINVFNRYCKTCDVDDIDGLKAIVNKPDKRGRPVKNDDD